MASKFTSSELAERAICSHAVEAVIWGMPAVNFELLYRALLQAKGDWNQIVYWSQLPNWKNQTLTPNPDTVYFFVFFNTMDAGPVVVEIPPAQRGSITGGIYDAWQSALEEVGLAGVDNGKGGKYLILPPRYKGKVPDGYIPLQSQTYAGFALLRSNLNSDSAADINQAVLYGKRVRLYPLTQAFDLPQTTFVDAINLVFESIIHYDYRFFQSLDHFIQREPWLERDKAMIDQLKSIGIEKGKPFSPDRTTRQILGEAAAEAHARLDLQYKRVLSRPFHPASKWAVPVPLEVIAGLQTRFANPDSYPVEGRAVSYSIAFCNARHVGQFDLMTIADKEGLPLRGARTYCLNVPANVPVGLYWSVTAYDRATHALIRHLPWSSRSSHTQGFRANADGSVEVYFGPEAPHGKEFNWIPTNPSEQFEVLFRFYGLTKAFFDMTWSLPDMEQMEVPKVKSAA